MYTFAEANVKNAYCLPCKLGSFDNERFFPLERTPKQKGIIYTKANRKSQKSSPFEKVTDILQCISIIFDQLTS